MTITLNETTRVLVELSCKNEVEEEFPSIREALSCLLCFFSIRNSVAHNLILSCLAVQCLTADTYVLLYEP